MLAGLVVLGLLAGGAVWGLPYLTGPGTGSVATPTTAARTPYQRADTPGWLPPGWSLAVDDEKKASVVAGPATNGGTCVYSRPGVLRVTRDTFDVSGCVAAQFIKDLVVTDTALEAQFSVHKGCAGMWPRTGHVGYFVDVCNDGSVALHKLGDFAPSTGTLIGGPWHAADPTNVVVGVTARGGDPTTLVVFIDGVDQPPVTDASSATNPALPTGRVALGGFAPDPVNAVDATITRFRAWTPAGAVG